MKKTIIKALKLSAGITLLIIGVIWIFLPIIPGILLIILGMFILEIDKEKKLITWIKEKIRK